MASRSTKEQHWIFLLPCDHVSHSLFFFLFVLGSHSNVTMWTTFTTRRYKQVQFLMICESMSRDIHNEAL